MINIIGEVNAYLKTKTTVYSPIIQNVFPDNTAESIICRTEPSSANERRYLDGTRIGTLNFAYYCKSKNQVTAREQLEKIISALDISGVTISEALTVTIEAVTLPAYVQKTEAGEHIFTASLKLEYLNRRLD